MTQHTALIGLRAETSIHAGAGSSVNGIDLPIQREAPTDWPCVYGSAVKGALRAKAEDKLGADSASISQIFGPASDQPAEKDHAGALLVGDARLLLLPIRALTCHFKWLTCPAILQRLQRDSQRLGIPMSFAIPQPDKNTVITATKQDSDLFLEEYRYTPEDADLSRLMAAISAVSGIGDDELKPQLAIVDNDQFSFLSRYATPVNAHIAIDNASKTVRQGALWYEETLPPETVLYFALAAQQSRAKDNAMPADKILASITDDLLGDMPYLQLGGNETVGMGWCKINVNKAGD